MQSRGRVYTGKWVAERETPSSSRDTKIARRQRRGCEVGGVEVEEAERSLKKV